MSGDKKIGGYAVFILLVLLAAAAAAFAFSSTGTMGIEERFAGAVGLPGGAEGNADGSGESAGAIANTSGQEIGPAGQEPDGGFFIEGSPILYLLVLLLLAAGCVIVYRNFRI